MDGSRSPLGGARGGPPAAAVYQEGDTHFHAVLFAGKIFPLTTT